VEQKSLGILLANHNGEDRRRKKASERSAASNSNEKGPNSENFSDLPIAAFRDGVFSDAGLSPESTIIKENLTEL